MNTLGKGKRIENMAEKYLQGQGYQTIKVVQTKWQKKDFFECFDILAVNKFGIRGVQCKANYCPPGVFEMIQLFAAKCPENFDVEVWVWKDRVGWTNKRFNRTDNKWEIISEG